MKNILVTLSFAFFAISTVSNFCLLAQPFGGGDGTVGNPYQISSREDWENLPILCIILFSMTITTMTIIGVVENILD